MIWQEFSSIQSFAQSLLPEGLELHTLRYSNSNTIIVRIVDEYEGRLHFTKDYSYSQSFSELRAEILEDVRKFNEIWNSPLMRALS